jgi:hypothetical protein
MRTQHGALMRIKDDEHLFTILKSGFTCWFGTRLATLDMLLEHAEDYDLTHLWIMPGSCGRTDARFAETYDREKWDLIVHYKGEGEAVRIRTVTGWRKPKGGQRQVTIIFAENTRWYGSAEHPEWLARVTPPQLLEVVSQVENKLGVPMAGSPQTTGWRLVRQYHPEWVRDFPKVNLREIGFTAKAARDMIATLPPKKRRLFLHKFDKGAAYLAAAASTDIGVGTPVKQFFFDSKGVGVYRVKVISPGSLTKTMIQPYRSEWLMVPHIRLLKAVGCEVDILEGYVFPERHDMLVRWAKTMWEARNTLEGPGRDAIKQIYTSTIGLTSSRRLDDEETDKKRPDIKYQIMARGYEIMWHNIAGVAKACGALPTIVYNDALYYLSDEADGRKAFPEVVRREGLLGGFRWEGCQEVDDDVWQVLQDDCSAAMKLSVLNERGWNYVRALPAL